MVKSSALPSQIEPHNIWNRNFNKNYFFPDFSFYRKIAYDDHKTYFLSFYHKKYGETLEVNKSAIYQEAFT